MRRADQPVHPHARGEHKNSSTGRDRFGGSSPRAWGTLISRRGELSGCRFIPTRVGNTPLLRLEEGVRSVHPHARGEHLINIFIIYINNGSSPRAWGTPSARLLISLLHWFIPTRVGNTLGASMIFTTKPVHPHARGEHPPARAARYLPNGSSPRAWGTHYFLLRLLWAQRFIPTRVGNTR